MFFEELSIVKIAFAKLNLLFCCTSYIILRIPQDKYTVQIPHLTLEFQKFSIGEILQTGKNLLKTSG